MTPSAGAAWDPARAAHRARERSALWTMTWAALYGPPAGESVAALDGELPEERLPDRLTRAQLVARPRALRRLLAPVISDPGAPFADNPDFRELVRAATRDLTPRPTTYEDALRRLKDCAGDRHAGAPKQSTGFARRAVERLLAAGDLQVVEPATIVQRGGVSTVSRRARFCVPLADIARIIDPENWLSMGPFFDAVGPVAGEKVERDDGWSGLLEEKFVVAWSVLGLQTYHTFLHVDYTRSAERVRTDYSLAYEVDDQIDQDSGFIEARRIPSRLGWCEYHAEKAMRFRSPQANLFAPMLMLVFLDSGLSAIEDAALAHFSESPRKVAPIGAAIESRREKD